MRIVSLLPSATEIVCALGLLENLVGRSHSCNHPSGVQSKPVMTRTTVPTKANSVEIDQYVRRYLGNHSALYQLDLEALDRACPDIIVSQRLCEVCAVSSKEIETAISSISSRPVLVDLEPACLKDVFCDVERIGIAAGVEKRANALIFELQRRVSQVRGNTSRLEGSFQPRVAMLEWVNPPFSSGHWNPELVALAGGIDCIGPKYKPSQTVSWKRIIDSDPDIVFLACCGFDIARTKMEIKLLNNHSGWRKLVKKVSGRVLVADGDAYFSRPGPRLVDSLEALAHALHPQVHPPAPQCSLSWL